jgi:hypothetical protein
MAYNVTLMVFVLAAGVLPGCELLPFFDTVPENHCDQVGQIESFPCGPCGMASEHRICTSDHRWVVNVQCHGNPYDLDRDGYANDDCFSTEADATCCGERDCDDDDPTRYPGHGDFDRDEHIDKECGGDDCDDSDSNIYEGHADRDGDTYVDANCGGDDCDDFNEYRYNGHADVDGDGHTDQRCCLPDTPMCDDCDDGDPLRWTNHADLDGDGRDSVGCGGDDCDDFDPRRWLGHADVDGDGHVDPRCCDGAGQGACDDCNDDDPHRWRGNADLDNDGHEDMRCGGDDCDDDCATCLPAGAQAPGDARDHDCDAVVDELEAPSCGPVDPRVVDVVPETGEARAVFASTGVAYVASVDGLFEIVELAPGDWEVSRSLQVSEARDVAVYGGFAYVATPLGLIVVDRGREPDLTPVAEFGDTGDVRAVSLAFRAALLATQGGLVIVDVSIPEEPIVLDRVGAPLIDDARDVLVNQNARFVAVLHGGTADVPASGVTFFSLDATTRPISLTTWGHTALTGEALGYSDNGDTVLVASARGLERVAFYGEPDLVVEVDEAHGIYVAPGLVFLATEQGLVTWNSIASALIPMASSKGVAVVGGQALVATSDGLAVVDLGCEP